MRGKIKSICGAEEWCAIFLKDTDKWQAQKVVIACWAVVEDRQGKDRIVGMVCGGNTGRLWCAEDSDEWVGYCHESYNLEKYKSSVLSLTEIELSTRVRNLLVKAKILTLGHLWVAARTSWMLPSGIGPKSEKEIQEVLQEYGLKSF